jgi:hypothetical protein
MAIALNSDYDIPGLVKPDWRTAHRPVAVIAMALLVGLSGQALARDTQGLSGSTPGQAVITSRGPAFVTGNLGSMQTTTLPGGGGQGFLMTNGNGTSTLIVPGGLPQTVVTPR